MIAIGGFVNASESADDGAIRIPEKLTGRTEIHMEQMYCFGEVDRDLDGRLMSIAYLTLIRIDNYSSELMKQYTSKRMSIKTIPSMIFDHKKMIEMAKQKAAAKSGYLFDRVSIFAGKIYSLAVGASV